MTISVIFQECWPAVFLQHAHTESHSTAQKQELKSCFSESLFAQKTQNATIKTNSINTSRGDKPVTVCLTVSKPLLVAAQHELCYYPTLGLNNQHLTLLNECWRWNSIWNQTLFFLLSSFTVFMLICIHSNALSKTQC